MRELKNGIKIIGVDAGYGNIKCGCGIVFKTAVTEYDTEPIFKGNILEFKGKYYRIGEGHKEFISDKSMDNDFYILTLMGIVKELKRAGLREGTVYLAAGLPLKWVQSQRDSFKEYLLQDKSIDLKYNDEDFHIDLIGCSIFPQAYPAVLNRLKDFGGINMLVDIGNGTMNILYMQDKKPVENKAWTEKLGVNQLVIRARNAVMDNYGVKIDESIIEQYIRYGQADISEKYIDLLHTAAVQYTKDVFAALNRYDYNPELMKLYITGGGGRIIKNFGEYDTERVEIIEDICAAAYGFECLAYMQFTRL
ncbi:MAG: ParM/StbA family protein [Clostridia bacterium]|nr:ParM/StbA family protein [Clostridia bacterium]